MEQSTDGAKTAAIDGLVSSWSENISVSFCLRAPGYGLTLWCALGLLVGSAIQEPQLQLHLAAWLHSVISDSLLAMQQHVVRLDCNKGSILHTDSINTHSKQIDWFMLLWHSQHKQIILFNRILTQRITTNK